MATRGSYGVSPGSKRHVQNTITANTGSSQATGEPLYDGWNIITTCGNAGDAVTMPEAVLGRLVRIINDGANSADVFPASGDNLDGAGANTAAALGNGDNISYFAVDSTNWRVVA